ncbi:hypothetical protein PMAYCL1PPCAC_00768, partial [Pristionchus mayeri]
SDQLPLLQRFFRLLSTLDTTRVTRVFERVARLYTRLSELLLPALCPLLQVRRHSTQPIFSLDSGHSSPLLTFLNRLRHGSEVRLLGTLAVPELGIGREKRAELVSVFLPVFCAQRLRSLS